MEGELSTNRKGAIAEAEICAAAVRLGIDVYRPIVEHGRADLVFGLHGRLLRVQCKWGALHDAVIRVTLRTSRHSPGKGYVWARYTEDEIDAVAVYCEKLSRCYLLPVSLIARRNAIHLRIEPTKNNQSRSIN